MKESRKRITRRSFLKAGLAAGGMGMMGFPAILRAQPKEIKVGHLAPLTGVSANWGQRTYWGFQLAADVINEGGGVKSMGGAKIKIVVADTETKPEVAGIQAEKLINDRDIIMLTGTNQSAASMVASQVAERSRIPFVTGTDGAPALSQRGFQYFYRAVPTMEDYGRDLIYFVRDMGQKTGKVVKKMAILVENSIFGVSGGDAAAKYARQVGFEVVDYSSYDAAATRDFTGYISKYKSGGVEFLACHSRPQDAILITRTMKELNFNPFGYGSLFGSHTLYEFNEALGKDANYVMGTTNFTDYVKNVPGMEKYVEMWKKRHNVSADATMLAGFVVLPILKAALEMSPTYDRERLKDAIEKVSLKIGEHFNLQIEGVKWTPTHDNAWVKAYVIQWENGKMHCVAPDAYAFKKGVWPRPTWDEIKKM